MQPTTATIELAGQRYLINRMEASDGSWIVSRLMQAMRDEAVAMSAAMSRMPAAEADDAQTEPTPEPTSEQQCIGAVRLFMANASRKDAADVQAFALRLVSQLVGDPEQQMPVVMANGSFTNADMRYDIPTVMALVSQVLIFNLTPFFAAGGLGKILQAATSL